jgi:hypothetical protein
MEEKFVDIDKLIVCCQPLYGERISEMRRQIEYLKLQVSETYQVFMAKHTVSKLKALIRIHGYIINCGCLECHMGDRTGSRVEQAVCTWQPIFEGMIQECGMTFSSGGPVDKGVHGHIKMDADAHFCSGLRGDWVTFVDFGKKFDTTSEAEFAKYTLLVKLISKQCDEILEEHEKEMYNSDDSDREYVHEFDIDEFYKELEDGSIYQQVHTIMNPDPVELGVEENVLNENLDAII